MFRILLLSGNEEVGMYKRSLRKRKELTRNEIIILFVLYIIYIPFSIYFINDFKEEKFQDEKRLEITGYFKEIRSAYKDMMMITLTNGNQYAIDSVMYHSETLAFQLDEFVHEVKYGDKLCLVVLENSKGKNSFIYQLECNGKVYLSYSEAMNAIQRNNEGGVLAFIIMDVIIGIFLVIESVRYIGKKKKGDSVGAAKYFDEFGEGAGVVKASVSGKVLKVCISQNQVIKKGEVLLIIESAQMQIPVISPVEGIIKDIYVNTGDKVQKNDRIILICKN